MAIAVLLTLILPAAEEKEPWVYVQRYLEARRDAFAGELETAHTDLLERAQREAPELVIRLAPEAPRPRPTGYGILPEVLPDLPEAGIEPAERIYSLEILSTAFAQEFRDAAMLAARASDGEIELAVGVTEYERLKTRLRDLEDHLAYHASWQKKVVSEAQYFAARKDLLAKVREWQRLERGGMEPERREALRREVLAAIAPFQPSVGLALVPRADGGRALPVAIVTDITDESFLKAFTDAVETYYDRSEAARAAGLTIDVSIRRMTPEELYPEGPPARGSEIDLAQHVARFPAGVMLLTTGARDTHAYQGRSLLLGSRPVHPRTLAHEFGHLLGFADAYLRAYDGEPGGPYGVRLVEWTGLVDDLMGNVHGGRVTREMVEQILDAYEPR